MHHLSIVPEPEPDMQPTIKWLTNPTGDAPILGEDDLPAGYRWANSYETENWEKIPGLIVVPRTTDCNGVPYTHGESDLAVPVKP